MSAPREPASEERDADDGAPVTTATASTTATATRAATTGGETTASRPEMYFLAHNVAKKHNVGTIARCCTAFGVKSLVLIGSREYNAFGAHGADGHVRFEHFDSLQDARKKLKEERRCTQILGVEIVEDARPIESHPFTGNTAFIMGNEVRSIDAEAIDGCARDCSSSRAGTDAVTRASLPSRRATA